jgi:hypothetical protein
MVSASSFTEKPVSANMMSAIDLPRTTGGPAANNKESGTALFAAGVSSSTLVVVWRTGEKYVLIDAFVGRPLLRGVGVRFGALGCFPGLATGKNIAPSSSFSSAIVSDASSFTRDAEGRVSAKVNVDLLLVVFTADDICKMMTTVFKDSYQKTRGKSRRAVLRILVQKRF